MTVAVHKPINWLGQITGKTVLTMFSFIAALAPAHLIATPDDQKQPASSHADATEHTRYDDFINEGLTIQEVAAFDQYLAKGKKKGVPDQVLFEARMVKAIYNRDREAANRLAGEAARRLQIPVAGSSAFRNTNEYLANVHSLLSMAAAQNDDKEGRNMHLGEAIWIAPDLPDLYLRAIEPPCSTFVRDEVRQAENEPELDTLIAAARRNGVPEQAIFESRLIYASLNDDVEMAARLEPEAAAWLEPKNAAGWVQQVKRLLGFHAEEAEMWSANQSGLNSEQQFLGFLHHILFLAALQKGDDEAAKQHLAEAIRNEPENAEDFSTALLARRNEEAKRAEKERVSNLRLDLDREIADSSGKKATMRALLGTNKALLLDFWASWCGPCIAGMPSLKEKAEVLAPQGIIVVAMNTENDAAKAEAQRKEHGMKNFPWMLDPEDRSYSELLGVDSIPRMVLVDPEGKVHFNGHPMDSELAAALQKIDPAIKLPEHGKN